MKINIVWKGPYRLERIDNLAVNWTVDFGVYQIVRKSKGRRVDLLYIGLTNYQNFRGRICQHIKKDKFKGYAKNELYFYLGRIAGRKQQSDHVWNDMVEKAEKLLIYSNQPKMNVEYKNTGNVPYDDSLFSVHVLNWHAESKRDFGPIFPESSGDRWTVKHRIEDFKVFALKNSEQD